MSRIAEMAAGTSKLLLNGLLREDGAAIAGAVFAIYTVVSHRLGRASVADLTGSAIGERVTTVPNQAIM